MFTSIFRNLIYAVFVVIMLQSCERDIEIYPQNEETSIAKKWYEDNGKPFPLSWSKSQLIKENNNTTLVVPLENGTHLGPDAAMKQNVVFTIEENNVVEANKVNVFSDTRTVSEFSEEAIANFVTKQVSTSKNLGKTYFMIYDLRDNLKYSQSLDSEGLKKVNLQLKIKDNDIMSKNSVDKADTSKNIPVVCSDWYLVQYFDDGTEYWTYLYTTCSGTASGGGGGGGGGGGAGSGGGSASYYYESPEDPIVLQQILNCFNNIPSNAQTTYKITIHSHLANPNLPTQVYNFSTNDPGHAYITMEKSNGAASRLLTFGFYPSQDTWITGTKNAVTSSIGQEDPDFRKSNARYTITVNETAFNNARNMALNKSTKPYDLNDYNCTDYAIDVFNTALGGSGIVVPDSPIGFTTPAGLYGKLSEMKTAGIPGISLIQTSAPSSTSACN